MKKVFILLLVLMLTGCAFKDDYFNLSIDDYVITVGCDDAKYLDIAFDFDLPEKLQDGETIRDVDIYLFDQLLGVGDFTNKKNREIDSENAILTKLTLYFNDIPGRTFKLDDVLFDRSIQANCDIFNGTFIKKNGYSCVIENSNTKELNVIELHGDYLNLDQDLLDHIIIYTK